MRGEGEGWLIIVKDVMSTFFKNISNMEELLLIFFFFYVHEQRFQT